MEPVIEIEPYGRLRRFLDWLMVPVMYILSGTLREKPQETHWWNVQTLTINQIQKLKTGDRFGDIMVYCCGMSEAVERRGWLYHMPIFGGWKNYVVLSDVLFSSEEWYVGWLAEGAQISLKPVYGMVRVLVGPGNIHFFGVNKNGEQIAITVVDKGLIGGSGQYSRVPLR